MDALDVLPHMGLSLPAPQHQLVDFLGACSRSLQDSALSDAFYHLDGVEHRDRVRPEEKQCGCNKCQCKERVTLKKPNCVSFFFFFFFRRKRTIVLGLHIMINLMGSYPFFKSH